jgi:hypothetical protein
MKQPGLAVCRFQDVERKKLTFKASKEVSTLEQLRRRGGSSEPRCNFANPSNLDSYIGCSYLRVSRRRVKAFMRRPYSPGVTMSKFFFLMRSFPPPATRMAQEGIDLATLAKILGDNSIRIVERYVHPAVEHRKSAMLRTKRVRWCWGRSSTGREAQLNRILVFS